MCDEHVKRGGRVLYLAHRKELLTQAAATFERTGLGTVTGKAPILHVGERIDVTSVPTAANRDDLPEPTMIVVDECHHIQAKTYQTVINRYPKACVVGLTATPIRLDGKGLGETFSAMVENVTAEWLIENHYLAPYKYYSIPTLDTSHLKKRMGEFTTASVDALFSEKNVVKIAGNVVEHYKRLAEGQQAICYCPSREISKQFASEFIWAGVNAIHLDGTTPAAERETAIQEFREGRIKVICNVDLLGEGFDVPDCAVTIMLRPTASMGLYIQQAMRCMRYQPDKQALILDHVGNYNRHGLPDDVHHWTLAGQEKRSKYSDVPPTRTCPKCYAVVKRTAKMCPECKFDFEENKNPFTAKRAEVEENAQLQEILPKKKRYAAKDDIEIREARSYEDFKRLERERGYRRGWAWWRAHLRGYV